MDKKYEIFSTWWHAPEQEELRRYCATGWGWKIWQAVSELQNGQQNIPEIIPGWKLVPVEPTEEMVIRGFESAPSVIFSDPADWAAYEAMSGCQQAAHEAKLCYSAMLAAAPEVNSGKTD